MVERGGGLFQQPEQTAFGHNKLREFVGYNKNSTNIIMRSTCTMFTHKHTYINMYKDNGNVLSSIWLCWSTSTRTLFRSYLSIRMDNVALVEIEVAMVVVDEDVDVERRRLSYTGN